MRKVETRFRGALALVVLLSACGGYGDNGGPGAPGMSNLAAAKASPSGDGQTGTVAQELASPLRIIVTRDGSPEAGAAVTWRAGATGASVNPASGITDADGIASSRWTLGQGAGPQTAQAAVSGAGSVSFSALAIADVATQLAIFGGNGQTGAINTTLAQPLQAKVSDQFGNGVPDVDVSWRVTAGAGSVPATSKTDAAGVASAQLALGATVGGVTIEASVAGLSGSPVIFSANASAAPSPTVQLLNSGGNRFDPATLTVSVGTTVTWVWVGGFHDVTSAGAPSFTSSGQPVSPPANYSFTFTAPGTYLYFCSVHGTATSGMRGFIVVQ